MASVVLYGDTSGAITVSAPAVAGTNTITFPALTGIPAVSAAALTSGRVPYATTGGALTDSANLTFNGSTLAVTGTLSSTGSASINGAANNYALNVKGAGTVGDSSVYLQLTTLDTGTTNADGGAIGLGIGSSPIMYLTNYENAAMVFSTNSSEKMRLTSSGNLLVGTTSSTAGYALKVGGANANILIAADSPNGATLLCDSSAAGSRPVAFGHITSVAQAQVRCGGSGGVYLSDGATSWAAISDETQKDVIEPITGAVERLLQWRTVIGKYKTDADGVRRPFLIAQDVKANRPEAVDDGEVLGLRYTETIPDIVAAIKELSAKVAALEAAIQEIKAEFDAYKAAHP
jgi:hypothetical protein